MLWNSAGACTPLDDATINTLFLLGASYHRPVDLPDTTGLSWREGVFRCPKVKFVGHRSLALACRLWLTQARQSLIRQVRRTLISQVCRPRQSKTRRPRLFLATPKPVPAPRKCLPECPPVAAPQKHAPVSALVPDRREVMSPEVLSTGTILVSLVGPVLSVGVPEKRTASLVMAAESIPKPLASPVASMEVVPECTPEKVRHPVQPKEGCGSHIWPGGGLRFRV